MLEWGKMEFTRWCTNKKKMILQNIQHRYDISEIDLDTAKAKWERILLRYNTDKINYTFAQRAFFYSLKLISIC